MAITHAAHSTPITATDYEEDHVGAPTLAEVLAVGNNPGGYDIEGADAAAGDGARIHIGDADASFGGNLQLLGGTAAGSGHGGGNVEVIAGASDAYADPGYLLLSGGDGAFGEGAQLILRNSTEPFGHGHAEIKTGGSFGTTGEALVSDGADGVVWGSVGGSAPPAVSAAALIYALNSFR